MTPRLRLSLASRSLVIAFFLPTVSIGSALAASVGTLRVTVHDENGKPITGVLVRTTFGGTGQSRSSETDANGQATIAGLPGGENIVHFEKPGFQIYEKNLRISVGGTEPLEVTLKRLDAPRPAQEVGPGEQRRRAALGSFNEAVGRFDAGDLEGAATSVEAALAMDDAFAPAQVLLAKIASRRGHAGEAADALIRALRLDPSQTSLIPGLVVELRKAGRAAEAAEYERTLQVTGGDSAGHLYNLAIVKLNAGDDDSADPLLQKALAIDPSHAQSVYQSGMIEMRRGKIQEARKSLARYLELAPQGEFAEDAREILKALGGS